MYPAEPMLANRIRCHMPPLFASSGRNIAAVADLRPAAPNAVYILPGAGYLVQAEPEPVRSAVIEARPSFTKLSA